MTTYYAKMRSLAGQNRWTDAFDLLRAEFAELADLLEKTLSEDALRQLAADLPFDPDAANLIWKRLNYMNNNTLLKDGMLRYATPPEQGDTKSLHATRYKKSHVALYCAAAAQYGLSKALTEIHELTKKKLAMVNTIHGVVDLAKTNGLEALMVALSRSSETDALAQRVRPEDRVHPGA